MSFHEQLLQQSADARQGLLATPIIQGCLRGEVSLPSYVAFLREAYHHVRHTVPLLKAMKAALPAGADWAAFAISRNEFPMVAQAALLGGNCRVGLEDNLYLERGVFASNGQLVEKAVKIIETLGARVLGPQDARAKLGLEKPC